MSTNADTDASSSRQEGFIKRIKHSIRSLFVNDTSQELQDLIESRDDAEIPLSDDEKELIASVLKFGDITAGFACVPRSDIVYVDKRDGFDAVFDVFKESGLTRLLVCGKDLDEVVGFISLKDMVPFIGREKEFVLKDEMHPCTFVPESLYVPAVLDEMRAAKVQIAAVVDEYGGTAGLITVKDIMEELVGDLDDAAEDDISEDVVELLNGRLQLDARLEIDDMDEDLRTRLGVTLDAEYETIGGFVLEMAGRVPEEGSVFELTSGATLIVTSSDGRRVLKVTYIPAEGQGE